MNRDIVQTGNFYNAEIHYFPSSIDYNFYYLYKIPYSQLYFEKNNNVFTSGMTVNIEVTDSAENVISRGFDNQDVSVKDFDSTTSVNATLQGLISLNLKEGHYKLFAIISDKISKRERRIPPVDFIISKSEKIFSQIILETNKTICDSLDVFVVSNNSSFIPFNRPQDILAIPVEDSTIKSISINVKRDDTILVSDEKSNDIFTLPASLKMCNKEVTIANDKKDNKIKYFMFDNFSAELSEGPVRLEIIPDQDTTRKKIIKSDIIWIEKPRSLMDPEEAIKLLSVVETKETVSKLLDRDDYKTALYSYWQKFDPTPDTKYNELMNEFYQRVDYCQKEFIYIDGNGGAKSDRGKTYIKFGPPNKIERNTTNEDKVVEIWKYENPKRNFVFIDNDGTGKFILVSEQ